MKKALYLSVFSPIILSLFFSCFFIPAIQNPHYSFINSSSSSYVQSDESMFIWPVPGYNNITSSFGYRVSPTLGASTYHGGIDIAAPENTNIYAIDSGIVSHAGWLGANGYTVVITHNNNYQSTYGHVSPNFLVSVGDYITKGDLIAKVGPKYVNKASYTTYKDSTGKYTNGATTRSTFALCNSKKGQKNKSP